jgi:hypothetical protein
MESRLNNIPGHPICCFWVLETVGSILVLETKIIVMEYKPWVAEFPMRKKLLQALLGILQVVRRT